MSTDTQNHLTRKAAGKIKIINCSNMQGRCSGEQALSASTDADLTAEKTVFSSLTSEGTTQAVGSWRFVAAKSYKKKKKQQHKNCKKWERQESVGNFTLEDKTGFRQKGDILNASVTIKCPGEDHR